MDQSQLKNLEMEDIEHVIDRASSFGGKISQLNPEKDETLVATFAVLEIKRGRIHFKLLQKRLFDPSLPIVVNLAYRSMSFRIEPGQFDLSDTGLWSQIPLAAKALEIRKGERFILPYRSEIRMTLHRAERRGASGDVEARIIDLGLRGLGINLLMSEDEALLQHDHIWIQSIEGVQLSQPIFAKVIYVSSRRYKDNQVEVRAGIELEQTLPYEIYESLRQRAILSLSA